MDGMMLLAMMMSISPNSTLCLFNRHATVTVMRRRQPEDSCTEMVCKVLNLEAPSHLSRGDLVNLSVAQIQPQFVHAISLAWPG